MKHVAPKGMAQHAPLFYPVAMLVIFFIVPFGIMLAMSFYHRVQGGFYEPAFEWTQYSRFLTPFFLKILGFSLYLSALTALISVAVGFPFTYLLCRLPRKVQVRWLVLLLSVLSLSEVIIGFSWSILLSRTAGLSNLLVALGVLDQPESWAPGFPALMLGMCYLAFPYAVLVSYPSLSRLDPELPEVAQTLGASPLRMFFTVVVPTTRNAIAATWIMVFVFTLGVYLLPQLLGHPTHWTLSVHITDQAIYQANLPFSAAMAVFLMVVSLSLVGLTLVVGKKEFSLRESTTEAR
ncbi:MAG: ABC transporter permease [Deltaproteobacteria bacterium]|nr:ABC transporter permease [Deltaproteobacteria bacterium]